MFDGLIPLLIVIVLLIWFLDYLEVIDVIGGIGRLIVFAVVQLAKLVATVVGWIVQLTAHLVRHLLRSSNAQSGASGPDAASVMSRPPSPERGSRAGRGRWGGSRKRPTD